MAEAGRLAFLVDGEDYFETVAATLERARRSVLIVGWDIHSQVALRRTADGPRDRLVELLERQVGRNPDLHAHILIWDCNVFCTIAREKLQTIRLGWQTHPRIHFELDAEHRLGACHHQKIVVVDDAVAFVGGFDLTARRWDTTAHAPEDPRRVDPSDSPYTPFHDVQVVVDGPAARGLAGLVRDRWIRATGVRLEPTEVDHDPWPACLRSEMQHVQVGIARTDSEHGERPDVREIEALYLDAIASARRWVFIENQYLSSDAIRRALTRALQRRAGPEVCVIAPLRVSGWLEESVMGALRKKVVTRLRAADVHDRFRVWFPRHGLSEENPIIVHSKVCIVDDRFLTVGSANLSNRSLGLDSECNLFVESAGDPGIEERIAAFRVRLLAEHLGSTSEQVSRAIERYGSLNRAVETLRDGDRRLEPLEVEQGVLEEVAVSAEQLLDPERPIEWGDLVGQFFSR